MQNNRFVVLTGHLNNYPLSDLVGILRHQRKSGRLLIEYPKGPATFFFDEGELVDAHLNDLTGLQAICVALAQPESAFNFNPLIRTSRRSIDHSLQRVVSELLGCWDDTTIQIESSPTPVLERTPANVPQTLQGRQSEPLALPPARLAGIPQRAVLVLGAAVLITIGLSTGIAVTGGFKTAQSAASAADRIEPRASDTTQVGTASTTPQVEVANSVLEKEKPSKTNRSSTSLEQRQENRASFDKQDADSSGGSGAENVASTKSQKTTGTPPPSLQPIKVVMQIENGRVLKASIANPRPGMDSFEALALRIARQRRYPATTTGGETITISVSRPD